MDVCEDILYTWNSQEGAEIDADFINLRGEIMVQNVSSGTMF